MDRIKKPRGDSKLETLPEDRQREIYERLQRETLEKVRAWLAQDGLSVSSNTLSRFHSSYAMKLVFRESEEDTENFLELLKVEMPELPQEKVAALGETYFNLQAIKARDPKLFLAMQTAKHRAQMDKLKFEQKERELALGERRFEQELREYQDKVQQQKRAIEGELAKARDGGITPDTLRKIEEAAKLL